LSTSLGEQVTYLATRVNPEEISLKPEAAEAVDAQRNLVGSAKECFK
jgi:hypothetical protein